jgi:WD40 repeat protein
MKEAHSNTLSALEVTPFGQLISASLDHSVKIWDIAAMSTPASGINPRPLDLALEIKKHHRSPITSMLFLSAFNILATGGKDKLLKIHSLADNKTLLSYKYHQGPITCLERVNEFSIVSGCTDSKIRVFQLDSR